jgi:DNA-binding SARP family transcriptional activator/DNA-binding beta-propeller fold protein YncE
MQFCLLGPLEVRDAGTIVPLGGPKQRTVLAHLLLHANRVVATERLIDAVWGDEPPDTARNTIQTYIRHLRKSLGTERIQHRSSGYVVRVETEEVDALRFGALVDQARSMLAVDPSATVGLLEEALGLWSGPPLADLSDQESLRSEVARLEELRLAAIEDGIHAQLAVGRHRELVPELGALIGNHPLRERLWGHLMVALYRSGRQGDALALYQRARATLRENLGVDPSPEIQRLQEQILRQDPALDLAIEPLRGYRLLSLIGEGAFGAVHRAFQPQVGREVAVKIIRPELANRADFIRRFGTEAQLVARLEHPHIVPLYDYWRDPDGAYLVMRYLRGGSLRGVISQQPLEVERAVRLIDQLALALTAAHRQGVVHRDVKPANVLFDEDGNAYLSDFGIAKDLVAAGGAAVPPGTPSGSLYYASPEELRGEGVTPRADLYGLGIVLFESLTGRHPFAGWSSDAIAEKHATEPLPPVHGLRPDVPASVDEVIARATAKTPEDRYEDARSLALALHDALGQGGNGRIVTEPVTIRNPYKGLRPFVEVDAADFFGRESQVKRVVARLAEDVHGSRFLAIVGPSGSGKSSLVRAGVIQILRFGALPGSESWFVADLIPGSRPFEELGAALMKVAAAPTPAVVERLERDEHGLRKVADDVLPAQGELLLVIDQFEEIFSMVDDEDVRARFLKLLVATTMHPDSRVRVVVTLRADFYDRPLSYKGFGDLLAARTQPLTALSVEELEQAVTRPADGVGVSIEQSVVVEMVTDVADQPGGLPLLQYALTELFDRRQGRSITAAAYRELGGVSGAIARRAEELYAAMSDPEKEATRQLFLRLITVRDDATNDHTRRRPTRSELASLDVDPDAIENAVAALAGRRLLSFDRDQATREPTIEIAHEALITQWERLRGWIEDAREDLRTQRRLAVATRDWIEADRDASFLISGSRLETYEAWQRGRAIAITSDERDFLDASFAERDRRHADEIVRASRERALRRQSIVRLWALVAVGVLALAVIAAAVIFVEPDGRGLGHVRANTVARLDLEDGEVAGGVQVGSRPTGVAVGEGAVWVTNQDSDTVSKIDPETYEVTDLGTRGSPTAVAVGEDAAWVVNGFDGTITRIDPQSNSARTISLDPGSNGLAVGFGYVWITNSLDGTLIRIDPQTLGTTPFSIGGRPRTIAIGAGSLWIADAAGDSGSIVRVDPSNGLVEKRLRLEVEPTHIAVDSSGVWVTSSVADALLRIDPSTQTVAARIQPVGNEPSGIAVGGGSVWVANAADGTVARIDPHRNRIVDRIHLAASPEGVIVDDNAVWVSVRAS